MNRLDRGSIALAVCLAALAGCVDAIGFLQLGGHFVSFMSGNSTQLAVGLVTDRGGAVLELTAIIVLFVIGAGLGTLTAHFSRTLQAFAVLAVVAGLLATAAAACAFGFTAPAIGLIAVAMGAENAVFQRDGDIVVGLTYMTGTLAKLGQKLAQAATGGPPLAFVPYLLLWSGLMAGGAAGACLYHALGLNGLWIAALWATLMALAARWNPA